MKIGVLAVQGDFEAHAKVLESLGAEAVLLKRPEDLAGCAGVILPGGESTTQLKFLQEEGLEEALKEFARAGGAFFGTCAGAILLGKKVHNPEQASLGLLDIEVARNAYGRQVRSQVATGTSGLKAEPLEMVFIRAPKIEKVGAGVEVLAEFEDAPVLVRQGKVMAATFHPELTGDTTVHQYFLRLARNGA